MGGEMKFGAYADIGAEVAGNVAIVELRQPPDNYFSNEMIREIAHAYETVDAMPEVRSILLCASGKSFCAGANLKDRPDTGTMTEGGGVAKHLYREGIRLFRTRKPVVAAVHGPAIGGGMGLAISADFRVTCKAARFSVNFARLGLHPGFGLTHTLPRLIGPQKAALLLLTGRRINGEEAVNMGVADVLAPQAEVRAAAMALATEISQSAPLAVMSIRETLRRGLADAVESMTERELFEQEWLRRTADFKEGVKSWAEKRIGNFQAR